MYIVIAGGGKASIELGNMLLREKHEVVIIEKDEEVAKNAAKEFKGTIIHGDATKVKILKSVNVESADVIFALTGNDIANFAFCVFAKKLGVPKAISLTNDPENEELFKIYGVDVTISPSMAVASHLKNIVEKPGFVTLLSLTKKAEIIEVTIPESAKVIGKNIKSLNLPKDSTIIAILRNDEVIVPSGTTAIEAKDHVIALSKIEHIEKLKKLLVEV